MLFQNFQKRQDQPYKTGKEDFFRKSKALSGLCIKMTELSKSIQTASHNLKIQLLFNQCLNFSPCQSVCSTYFVTQLFTALIFDLDMYAGSAVKNLPAMQQTTCNAGDVGLIPGSGSSQPTPVFLSRKSHGQRSLVGYSPWRCKSWT